MASGLPASGMTLRLPFVSSTTAATCPASATPAIEQQGGLGLHQIAKARGADREPSDEVLQAGQLDEGGQFVIERWKRMASSGALLGSESASISVALWNKTTGA